jgi:hypothetical protein
MLEKRFDEAWPMMFGNQGRSDFPSQVIKIIGNEVGQITVLGMAPAVVDHIEIGGIGR